MESRSHHHSFGVVEWDSRVPVRHPPLDFHKTAKGIYYSHEEEEDIFIQSFGVLVVMTESE
jgi:hypothetical protein